MYRFQELDENKQPKYQGAARDACILEMFDAGDALPFHTAVQVLGKHRTGQWWDSFGPLEAKFGGLIALGDGLKPGELRKIEQSDLPAESWDRHRKKAEDPKRHGLTLPASPAAVAIHRLNDQEGNDLGVGVLIGY